MLGVAYLLFTVLPVVVVSTGSLLLAFDGEIADEFKPTVDTCLNCGQDAPCLATTMHSLLTS